MEFKKIKITDLVPAAYNPRKALKPGDKEYEKIKGSITEFGYVDPVIVNKDMTVIGGHQRISVLKDLGFTEIDCVVIDIDKTKEKALNIALNKITGEWNKELLADLIMDLQESDFDVNLTGFDPPEIEQLMSSVHDKDIEEDDFDIDGELAQPPLSRLGDLWILGDHRLLCGDSTIPENYDVLMEGKRANLVVTDPPYNVDYEGSNMEANMEDDASIYVFHSDSHGLAFRKAFEDAGFYLSGCCIWKKQSLVLGRSPYQWQHEPVLYGWKKAGKHQWYSDRKQSTIWEYEKPKKNDLHPTMKPIALIAYPIKNSSMSHCIVLDPFGGSGSTMIACEETGRACRMMELDEKFVDVIVKRYIDFVGSSDGVILVRDDQKIPYEEISDVGGE